MSKLGMDHFKKKLKEQLGFLRRSCVLYDQGFLEESIRMAATIRVLLHHTAKPSKGGKQNCSVSLLNHLKKPYIHLFSIGGEFDPNERPGQQIAFLDKFGVYGGVNMSPPPSVPGSMVPAGDWWNGFVLIMGDVKFTRKDLVLTIANKDGGAHVDEELPPDYEALVTRGIYRIGGPGIPGPGRPLLVSHLIAIRHITAELLRSPELAALAD